MFAKALPENQKQALALLGKSQILKDAYLAGGTALALQLNHRESIDFDFFTSKDFLPSQIVVQLSEIGRFTQEKIEPGTIIGGFENIKFSLFHYSHSLLKEPIIFSNIKIACLEDIAAMKLVAICDRGTKKDFVDIYFLLQKFSLAQILEFYDQKYKKLEANKLSILKSLTYFVDTEDEPMPKMIKQVSWGKVKAFIRNKRDELVKEKGWT